MVSSFGEVQGIPRSPLTSDTQKLSSRGMQVAEGAADGGRHRHWRGGSSGCRLRHKRQEVEIYPHAPAAAFSTIAEGRGQE